jgi:hypothetical protein
MSNSIINCQTREEIKDAIIASGYNSNLMFQVGTLNNQPVFADYIIDSYEGENAFKEFISYISVDMPDFATAYDNENDMGFETGDYDLDETLEGLRYHKDENIKTFLESLNLESYDYDCFDGDYVFYFDIEEIKDAVKPEIEKYVRAYKLDQIISDSEQNLESHLIELE